ncbi:hypothetical protein ASD98_05190 [Flavobacterium sp. Root186]|nr:hypothetical protein ASD98_05190 [Flavobacterium sp. Root186]
MKRDHLYFLITILLAGSFLGCAGFSKKKFAKDLENLSAENISRLEGNYVLNPISSYTKSGATKIAGHSRDSIKFNNAYDFIVNQNFMQKRQLNTIKSVNNTILLNLKFENNKQLSVKVLENSMPIVETVISGEFKDGMFYLDNKFLKWTGVPYLLGGSQNNKRRIGLAKNGNLLINEAVSNNGAFLFIFWAGSDYNLTYEYQRE